MNIDILTKKDLDEFKQELLIELKTMVKPVNEESRGWIKSYQVKNLLKISAGTLHKLRCDGTLNFTRIGHIIYYKHEEVLQVLEGKSKVGSKKLN